MSYFSNGIVLSQYNAILRSSIFDALTRSNRTLFVSFGINLVLFPLFLFLSGCGYVWQNRSGDYSVSVPYVAGDSDGSLTAELVRALALSEVIHVTQSEAPYQLQARLIENNQEVIGYRRDRQQIGSKNQKNLLAVEARKTVVLEASVYEQASRSRIAGPFSVEASVDFDYVDGDSTQDLTFIDSHGNNQVVLPFSLGQLESMDAAAEAARRPLHEELAKKLVDALNVALSMMDESRAHQPQ